MKITNVECLVLANEYPIVRISTDDGLVGWGECFRRARRLIKPTIDEVLRPLLIGANPLDTEILQRRLLRSAGVAGPLGTLAPAVAWTSSTARLQFPTGLGLEWRLTKTWFVVSLA